jgi:hypothetical protein
MRRQRSLFAIGIALILSLMVVAMPATANIRIADDLTPFYARIVGGQVTGGDGEVFHDGDWAVIPFYRPPTCIPSDFNLLDFFHVPNAFSCGPQTMKVATIWRNGPPPIDNAPIMAKGTGLGDMPVWFVSWPELEAAIADGVLTIGDLASLPSLIVGTASFYTETLRPHGAALVPGISFVARGDLEDGRSFRVQATSNDGAGRVTNTRIAFK